jgi:DNA mismatch repair protein MutL
MKRIQPLPSTVVSQIAAGEIIERPASVLKELIENAIDAGSSRIDVEVEQGGIELIRVVDNGGGILPEDLPLAFARHATSKLVSAEDLFRIGTLGFRGEALASIGSVAQVLLQARAAGRDAGAEIACQGGELGVVRPWNGSPGTRVEVRHLFYNTPVRRKFLRTTATEMGHVCEAFTRLALAQPTLHLTLRHNGKTVYEVPASADLAERIGLFFGAEVRDQLYPVEGREGLATLHGFIADPSCERGTAKMQYLFVNGRCIRDRSLGHALQEAYRGLLMTGRYAVAVLFLELPPEQVDVNVHPTKAEVRFRDGHALYHLVFRMTRHRLQASNLTTRLRVPVSFLETRSAHLPEVAGDRSGFPEILFQSPPPALAPPPSPRSSIAAENSPYAPTEASSPEAANPGAAKPDTNGYAFGTKAIQLYDAYLVLETPEGMLVIDQHALHERILFEQLKERMRRGPLEKQQLLTPDPVDLPPEQTARALEYQEALAELGLEVSDFGGGTLLLRSYPAILGKQAPQAILRAVLDHLVSQERPPSREQLLHDLLSLMACHAAVKAGDHLTPEEVAALAAQRELARDTHHCPHGRPTSLLLSRQELDRQFRRV